MITIIHGDNLVQSREKLFELVGEAKKTGQSVETVAGKSLTGADLESKLGGISLFGEDKTIIIEGLNEGPASKKKDELISLVNQYHQQSLSLILWEKKSLSLSALKKFPQALVFEFKTSKSLFKWLESLTGSGAGKIKVPGKNLIERKRQSLALLHQALDQDGAVFAFTMLCRQVRLLIQIKDSNSANVPPFSLSRLKQQASSFSLPELVGLYHQLLEVDYAQKTSKSLLSLDQQLDLIVAEL